MKGAAEIAGDIGEGGRASRDTVGFSLFSEPAGRRIALIQGEKQAYMVISRLTHGRWRLRFHFGAGGIKREIDQSRRKTIRGVSVSRYLDRKD